jgi:hypothetical protein
VSRARNHTDCYSAKEGELAGCVYGHGNDCPMKPMPGITLSSRGFKRGEPIPSTYGGAVRVYESSSAMAPHLWVAVTCPADLNKPDGPEVEAVAHITLESAEALRDQLTFLIDHHYQMDDR